METKKFIGGIEAKNIMGGGNKSKISYESGEDK